MVGEIAFALFGSVTLATIASLLIASEGLHFTMSAPLLDMLLMFFALAGTGALSSIATARGQSSARSAPSRGSGGGALGAPALSGGSPA